MTNTFAFQAGARPVLSQTKYKEESDGERISYHISVDPRVARGLVYSHHKVQSDTVKPIKYRPRPIPVQEEIKEEEVEEEEVYEQDFSPELLEIDDRPIEEDTATAAETYIQRPPTPHFVPDEPGIDVATQVGENDLFNFDVEVRPMIKVIVQHTLLRALAEVHEEAEVENIQKHRDRFEVERNTILAELQRLEAKAQRKFDEDKRRREQRDKVYKEIQELNRSLASRGFAEYYATDVVLHAMDILESNGFFIDEVEQEVNDVFLPWLSTELGSALTVKDTIVSMQANTLQKADIVQRRAINRLKRQNANNKEKQQKQETNVLRRMLIEDKAASTIRTTMKEYHERKEREAAEKAAAEEAAALAAEAEAEEAARRAEEGGNVEENTESETESSQD